MSGEDDGWRYASSRELDKSLLERLSSFPREPEMGVYALRSAGALLLRAWLRLYHRLSIQGRERLPREGSFILVANHASHLDALCLLSALPLRTLHRTFPVAAKDYFFRNQRSLGLSVVMLNALPLGRGRDAAQGLAQVPHLRPPMGLPMNGRPIVFNSGFGKVPKKWLRLGL